MAVGIDKSNPRLIPLREGEILMIRTALRQYQRMARFSEDAAIRESNATALIEKLDKAVDLPELDHLLSVFKLDALEEVTSLFSMVVDAGYVGDDDLRETATAMTDKVLKLVAPDYVDTDND